jgi:hypothetical protein
MLPIVLRLLPDFLKRGCLPTLSRCRRSPVEGGGGRRRRGCRACAAGRGSLAMAAPASVTSLQKGLDIAD